MFSTNFDTLLIQRSSISTIYLLIWVWFCRDCEDLIRDRIIGLPGQSFYSFQNGHHESMVMNSLIMELLIKIIYVYLFWPVKPFVNLVMLRHLIYSLMLSLCFPLMVALLITKSVITSSKHLKLTRQLKWREFFCHWQRIFERNYEKNVLTRQTGVAQL